MDDLELRRRLLSDPHDNSQDVLAELHANKQNKKYADSLLELDAQLEQAFKVEAPDDLADKILFQQSSSKVKTVSFSRKSFALAASILFTFGLFIGQINWGNLIVTPAQANLVNMAMAHIEAEEPFIKGVNEGSSHQEMESKLGVYSYALDGRFPYHIYYLNHCGFSKEHHALHIVFQGTKGRVTAFISNIPVQQQSQFESSGKSGEITPLPYGSLVLVGQQGEDINAISQQLTPLLQFNG